MCGAFCDCVTILMRLAANNLGWCPITNICISCVCLSVLYMLADSEEKGWLHVSRRIPRVLCDFSGSLSLPRRATRKMPRWYRKTHEGEKNKHCRLNRRCTDAYLNHDFVRAPSPLEKSRLEVNHCLKVHNSSTYIHDEIISAVYNETWCSVLEDVAGCCIFPYSQSNAYSTP